jgi:4-hydroxy-2-oxoheptanedioate aldolase
MMDIKAELLSICKQHNVIAAHPHVEAFNAEQVIGEGWRYLCCGAPRSYATLDKARSIAART